MQPCPVCGGMAVDPNGYCTQCRTFRGQPTQPVSGTPYPTTSAYPYSGPPMSGAGYSAPPAPTAARNRYMLPLIASLAVLVLLVGAIVVLAIVRNGGKNGAGPGPSTSVPASTSTAPSAAIDACLVGTWQAASESQQQDYPSIGPITMIGKGQISHVYADGQVDDDYSQATPYTGSYQGHVISMVVSGTVHSRITTSGGTLTFHDPQPNGSVVFKLDGSQVGSAVPLSIDPDPVQYTCLNNTFTEHTSQYDVTMTKTSPNP